MNDSWRDIDSGLAADFDGSLSGLGVELGSGAYNMSEALLALPAVLKEDSLEPACSFQYILGAPTSPATRLNEETLTYLNQGQSYQLKLKRIGEDPDYKGTRYKSLVRIVFHERRLQYMEKEQMETWRQTRPGERIIDIDMPLSYGIQDVIIDPLKLNVVEFTWDPLVDTSVFIQVNCISTEFTAKKHGGEKGVPFRLQVDTLADGDDHIFIHSGSCQFKVFKPKGADRKHKTDRERMDKYTESERKNYQPSYECTVLSEIPLDQLFSTVNSSFGSVNSTPKCNANDSQDKRSSPCSPSSAHSPSPSLTQISANEETQVPLQPLSPDATAKQTADWLQRNRFAPYVKIFQYYSGADLLRLTRDDLIQICGLADGIRLNNLLQFKIVRPRLTLYLCLEHEQVYHAVYLETLDYQEFVPKIANLMAVPTDKVVDVFVQGPSQIRVRVTTEVILNLHDQSRFAVEIIHDDRDNYRILLKAMP